MITQDELECFIDELGQFLSTHTNHIIYKDNSFRGELLPFTG